MLGKAHSWRGPRCAKAPRSELGSSHNQALRCDLRRQPPRQSRRSLAGRSCGGEGAVMPEKESGVGSEQSVTGSAETSRRADRDPAWQVFFCGALYFIAVYAVGLELEPITSK